VILYMDTSSLLKFYIEEEGSHLARRIVAAAQVLAMSRVGYAEARAGLARAFRTDRLDDASFRVALRGFEERWRMMSIVEASDSIVRWAGDLAQKHALRGFDAIHLSSALFYRAESQEAVTFSAWDDRLAAAAQMEGLDLPAA
jgi:uncharacterized protein